MKEISGGKVNDERPKRENQIVTEAGLRLCPHWKGDGHIGKYVALMCLAYNIERAKNLLGFEKMMKLMEG